MTGFLRLLAEEIMPDIEEPKSFNLEAREGEIYREFDRLYPPPEPQPMPVMMDERPFIVAKYDDYVIVCENEIFYKVPYILNGEKVEFVPRSDWKEAIAKQEWIEAKKSIELKYGARNSRMDKATIQNMHDASVKLGAECQMPDTPMKSLDDEYIFSGDAVKAVSVDGGAVKLGGYLIRFSDANNPDIVGDYFTKGTDFGDATQSDTWFNHRMPVRVKKYNIEVKYTEPLSGKAVLRMDNVGVFAEVVIEARNEYEKTIAELGLAGKLAWSSGTASHLVDRKAIKNGVNEITRWRLGLDASLTPTPAEYRKTNQIMPIKSLLTSDSTALPVEEDKSKELNNQPVKTEKNKMNENEDKTDVADIAAKAVADAFAKRDADQKAEAQKAAELKAAEDTGYKKAVEEIKAAGPQTFYHSTSTTDDDNDGIGAFKSWLKSGQENEGLIRPDSSFENIKSGKAAWNITTGASGGFLVPDPLYNQIIAKRNIMSWVRQVPCTYLTTPSDHLLVPREDTSLTDFVLTAEAGSYNEDEGTVSQKDLILYKYTKLTKMNEEFLMYNGTNWESWFTNALGRAVANTENTVYTTGTGTAQPEGVVTGATVANTTATTDIILPSELSALIGYLGGGYNVPSESAMLMANVTKWYLKGSGGTSVAPFAYVQTPQDGDFFGYKAVVDDDLDPYTTASAKCVVFGNFSYYAVVEKPGMIIQRNPYLYMATGQIGIFASIFRGGGVLQSEAFYYLTNKSS